MLKEGLVRKGGGAERVFTRLANDWSQKGLTIEVLTFDEEEGSSFYPLNENISWHRLTQEKVASVNLPGQLSKRLCLARKIVKQTEPDRLVSFGDVMNAFCLWLGLMSGKKAIVSDRNHPLYKKIPLRFQFFRHILFPTSHRIILQTEGVRSLYPSYLQRKIIVLPNPAPEVSGFKKNDFLKNPIQLLAVAKLLHQKGLDVLIQALAGVQKVRTDWKLTLLGEGSLREPLEKQIRELNLESFISMPGIVSDLSSYYEQSDLFILSSRFEGYPNVLLEAMSFGVPVISTRCSYGPEEIIQHQMNGWLVDVEDPDSLANVILHLMNHPEERERLAEAGKETCKNQSLETISQKWLDLLS